MSEPICTCTELERMTVCHDIRNEPHLVGCPRWGTPSGYVLHPAELEKQAKRTRDYIRDRYGVTPEDDPEAFTAQFHYGDSIEITFTRKEATE